MTDETQAAPGDAEPGTPEPQEGATRREFIATATVGSALLLGACRTLPAEPVSAAPPQPTPPPQSTVQVELEINGQPHSLELEPRVTLLDTLRERLELTGTKKGCDHGQCGACTVLVNGRRVLSCLTLAVMHDGAEVRTVEGLAEGDSLHPLQQAFIEHDAFQCGYCTPGQLMSACALLSEPCGPSDDEVREAMSGNLCRCGAYPNIVAAIQKVRHVSTP